MSEDEHYRKKKRPSTEPDEGRDKKRLKADKDAKH